MTSLRNQKLKKVLKGIGVAIIIYITISMLATIFVHDMVFRRYDAGISESILSREKDATINCTDYSYPCGDNILKSTLYSRKKQGDGLIVFAPGFNSQSSDYEGVIYAFLQEGFDVFAFDPTGHGKSGGKTSVGFPQIIKDIDATLNFINSSKEFNYSDIFLLGHSRGGYGVCCAMNDYNNITAVVSVNGVNTSMDAIMAYSTQYVGKIAYANYPFLDIYQDIIFGRKISGKSAAGEINESQIPVLIIQSQNDSRIPKDKYSIYSHRDKTSSEYVDFLLYNKPGWDDHNTIMYNETKQPNYDIVKIISEFYKQKTNDKELLK